MPRLSQILPPNRTWNHPCWNYVSRNLRNGSTNHASLPEPPQWLKDGFPVPWFPQTILACFRVGTSAIVPKPSSPGHGSKSHPCQNPGSRKYPVPCLVQVPVFIDELPQCLREPCLAKTMVSRTILHLPFLARSARFPEPSGSSRSLLGSRNPREAAMSAGARDYPEGYVGWDPKAFCRWGKLKKLLYSLGQDDSMICLVCEFIMVPCVLIYKYNRHNIHMYIYMY